MWIDTHCHLDASEFGGEEAAIVAQAREQGVDWIVIPAVARVNFAKVTELSQTLPGCVYALGIHPIFVPTAEEEDLDVLRDAVAAAMQDKRFVAIGEIGLDFFVPALKEQRLRDKQEFFFSEQLKIARDFDLPVLMHVRRSVDIILKHLRRIEVLGGVAHAYNGSFQQTEEFIKRGFKLGFGGAMTFTRALQIRRLAAQAPIESVVLETDAPDISPVWVHPGRNSPAELPRIAETMAELRGMDMAELAQATSDNARAAMPRLAQLSHF